MSSQVESGNWSEGFLVRAAQRSERADPQWSAGSRLDPAIVRSLQKFQVGESGDGFHLIANAADAGDRDYEAAVRLFVAEEQNHARMLALLLRASGAQTKRWHWSDSVFVHLRRLLGLRLELMVLTIAEVVALRYYRALADRGSDRLLTDVAERILADERHHVPFQIRRLRLGFRGTSEAARIAIKQTWRAMALAVIVVVAIDHGRALGVCGVSRRRFVTDTIQIFDDTATSVFPLPRTSDRQ
ncbi:ferritin-like domain-containing protein [Gordonia terrae]|uniref:ferritin-like domain-containing protein n=1 Tax=Gordonia terrae TaxID=2055 RepID=UPI00200B479F|nr:ferritin-like domain-containing protein [Gordonia terrae]UPW07791.1 ferritin-like domain-containing protein [Gordonia terrae]